MILDERAEFADAVALTTGATGTKNIGNIIDLGVARDIGQKTQYLVIQVDTAIVGTSSTVAFQVVSDSTDTISVSTQTIHSVSKAFPEATLVAGHQIIIPLPPENPPYERYLAVQIVIGVANLSAGKINAFLTLDSNGNRSYPDGIN